MADSKMMWKGLPENKAKVVFMKCPAILGPGGTKLLEPKEFRMLVRAFYEVFPEWEGLGICLHISPQILKEIKLKCRGNTVRGMICILNQWVKGNHGLVELRLCWHSVAYIIADSIGGKNPAAAKKIANNFQHYQNTEYMDGDDSALDDLDDEKKKAFVNDMCKKFFNQVEAHWFEIGVLLGVPIHELETFEADNDVQSASGNYMRKVIMRWIGLSLAFDYLPTPTVQILVAAIAHKMGGSNEGLAKKLAGYSVAQAGKDQNPNQVQPAALQQEQQQQEQQQQQQPVAQEEQGRARVVHDGGGELGPQPIMRKEDSTPVRKQHVPSQRPRGQNTTPSGWTACSYKCGPVCAVLAVICAVAVAWWLFPPTNKEIVKPLSTQAEQDATQRLVSSPSPPAEMASTLSSTSDIECHKMNVDGSMSLEKYLRNVNVKPQEKLCSRLELENCNELGRTGKLDPYNLADEYLKQKPDACWEHFVSILCELLERKVANNVAKEHGVNYKKHCL